MCLDNIKMDTCCLCVAMSAGLIAWGYIKMMFLLLAGFPLYMVMVMIAYHGRRYEMIIFWVILVVFPLSYAFVIVLIIGSHTKNMKILKVCSRHLIFELVALILLVPWIMKIIFWNYGIYGFAAWPIIIFATILLIAQEVYSIFLVKSEITKLSDFYEYGISNPEDGYRTIELRATS